MSVLHTNINEVVSLSDKQLACVVNGYAKQQARDAAQAAATGDASKVTKIDHANGMRQYKLNGQADEALVAIVRADGSLEYRCSEHGVVAGQPHDVAKETRNDR